MDLIRQLTPQDDLGKSRIRISNMNEITFGYLLGAVRRHKIKACLTFVIMMALVVAAYLVWPRKYISEGQLFVQLGRNNSSLDPTPNRSSISIQDTRETEIRSVAEIVGSRGIIEQVVDLLTPERILYSPLDDRLNRLGWNLKGWSGNGGGNGLSAEEYERLRRREQAIKKVSDALSVSVQKKTSIISVSVKAGSPELAQQIVDALMTFARKRHLDIHAVSGSARFYETEFQRQQQVLQDAIERQRQFRDEFGFLSAQGARTSLQTVVDKIEGDLVDARAKMAEADEQYARLKDELSRIEPEIEVPRTGVERLSYEDSTTELFTLKREAERLRSTYTENHPQIPVIEAQIAQLERELKTMSNDRVENERRRNPVYEQIQVDLVRARTAAQAARARLDELERKQAQANQRMEQLNRAQARAESLQREIDVARQDLAIYVQKRGEAKVLDQLDRQRISDVVGAQPATFVRKRVSPKGSIVLPIGMVLAAIAALAVALFSERKYLGNIDEEEIESILEVPVLVSLPRVRSVRQQVS